MPLGQVQNRLPGVVEFRIQPDLLRVGRCRDAAAGSRTNHPPTASPTSAPSSASGRAGPRARSRRRRSVRRAGRGPGPSLRGSRRRPDRRRGAGTAGRRATLRPGAPGRERPPARPGQARCPPAARRARRRAPHRRRRPAASAMGRSARGRRSRMRPGRSNRSSCSDAKKVRAWWRIRSTSASMASARSPSRHLVAGHQPIDRRGRDPRRDRC